MIKRVINIDEYWRVIVYFNVDYGSYRFVAKDIEHYTSPVEGIVHALTLLIIHKVKGVTISTANKQSIVCFAKHKTLIDYINSIVHEAEHIKQGMLKHYKVADRGEAPAYTVGYIASRIIDVFLREVSFIF